MKILERGFAPIVEELQKLMNHRKNRNKSLINRKIHKESEQTNKKEPTHVNSVSPTKNKRKQKIKVRKRSIRTAKPAEIEKPTEIHPPPIDVSLTRTKKTFGEKEKKSRLI